MFRRMTSALALVGLLTLTAAPAFATPATRLVVAAVGTGAPAVDPNIAPPQDLSGAAADVLLAINLKKSGQWVAMALVLSQLLIFLVKMIPATKTKMKEYGTLVVLVLSATAAVLAQVVGGVSPAEAVLVFLTTGAPKFVNDLLHELGILDHKTPADPPAPPAAAGGA